MSGDADFTSDEVVMMLGLSPLPNGGWGKDMATSEQAEPTDMVSAYRLILPEMADWRSIENDELWTAYMGEPLQIELQIDGNAETYVIEAGKGSWVEVPHGCWLRLTPLGDWSLAGRVGQPEVFAAPI